MKIALQFELSDHNRIVDTDTNKIIFCSDIKDSRKKINISVNSAILGLMQKMSNESIDATRKNLKEAVEKAIKDKREAGVFFLHLDKGAFDFED